MVDVVLELDLAPAAAHRRRRRHRPLRRAGRRLVAVVTGEPVNLIETLADRLLARLPGRPAGRRRHGHRAQAAGARSRTTFADVAVTMPPDAYPMTRAVLVARQQPRRPARRTCAAPSPGSATRCWSVSGVYETPPWGDPTSRAYLNAVVLVADAGARRPRDWLDRARAAGGGGRPGPRPGAPVRPAYAGRGRHRGLGRRRTSR